MATAKRVRPDLTQQNRKMNTEKSLQALATARLYGILDLGYVADARAVVMAEKLIRGGVQILQLRAKGRKPSELRHLANELLAVCRHHGVPFIVNDEIELAAEVGSDGCHLGQDDTPVAEARRRLPRGSIVGLSTHSLAQVREALLSRPDYIGFGPLFATPTKPDYQPIGLDHVAEAVRTAPFPVFCIGGINLERLPAVLAAGAERVVMVSALLQSADSASTAAQAIRFLRGESRIAPHGLVSAQ